MPEPDLSLLRAIRRGEVPLQDTMVAIAEAEAELMPDCDPASDDQ